MNDDREARLVERAGHTDADANPNRVELPHLGDLREQEQHAGGQYRAAGEDHSAAAMIDLPPGHRRQHRRDNERERERTGQLGL